MTMQKLTQNRRRESWEPISLPPAIQTIRPLVHLHGYGALYFEEFGLLAVADLHYGYAEAHRRRGHLLPSWGDERILERLSTVLACFHPRECLFLGDTLHTLDVADLVTPLLSMASKDCSFRFLKGNHDRAWPLAREKSYAVGSYQFLHGDDPEDAEIPDNLIRVCGHWHPATVVQTRSGLRKKLPSFLENNDLWILPAFSPWASGGVSTPREASPETRTWVVAGHRIWFLPSPGSRSEATAGIA